MASQVIWACPTARQRSYWDCGLRPSPAGLATDTPPATAELSRFPYMVLTHMLQVSGSGELKPALALSHRLHIAFPTVVQGRRSRGVISEINTAPVRTSANASPLHHWSSTHSLRPKRVASPYSAKDSHLLHHAGFDRRFHYVPHYRHLETSSRASPNLLSRYLCTLSGRVGLSPLNAPTLCRYASPRRHGVTGQWSPFLLCASYGAVL
jgi:hypothetical protein